jgi:hypothetical protein
VLLSMSQVAEELSCSRASVYGLIHGGHLARGHPDWPDVPCGHGDASGLRRGTDQAFVPARCCKRSHQAMKIMRAASTSGRAKLTRTPMTAVVPATRPPRPPRPRQTKASKKDVAETCCAVAELGERWWGLQSATALVERSGVRLTVSAEGSETFRYGDLVAWVEGHHSEFEQWLEEFDPTLRRRRPNEGSQ